MKKTVFFILSSAAITALLISINGCENSNKEVAFGCDTTNIKFSATIKSIMSNKCDRCHSAANASTKGSNIVLESHSDVWSWVDTTTGSDLGTFYNDVKTGKMPDDKVNGLTDCEIAKVAAWIRSGAKNN